ncbi:MAG: serine hydrolase domain-containing protein [Phormidesmis sp.]
MRFDGGYLGRLLRVATAYKAKVLCSGVFVSGRSPGSLLDADLAVDGLLPLRSLNSTIDAKQRTVTVSCLGQFKSTALYRSGLGSTLVLDSTVAELQAQAADFGAWAEARPRLEQDLPVATVMPAGIDAAALAAVVEGAFVEDNPRRLKRSRAVVIVHRGQIIAERYADGFSVHTPMLGWSLAKSVVNALIGVLVHQGRLALDAKDLLPAWRQLGDARREITLDQLLRMSSGLSFSENYASPLSDVTTMLFQRGDGAAYVAQRPLDALPGEAFCYASGTTVLLCRIIREVVCGAFADSLTDYFAFPRRALFDRLGMASAVLEPDAAGTFTGSSFMYATARDWAKLGLLYLWDGCWQGERILPAGWVAYSSAPNNAPHKTTREPADFYGAHFWRGVPNSFMASAVAGTEGRADWPQGAYLASGYQGQFVTVLPQQDLVVVRLGLSQRRNSWDHHGFIVRVAAAVTGAQPKA